MPAGAGVSVDAPAQATRPGAKVETVATGSVARADVEQVVDAGVGRFLSRVEVEASLSGGKFVGWSIVALQPPDSWRGVDLMPGDVVTRVNGMRIEREMDAYEAFQAVRQAPSLEVSYLRQGQPRTLRYAIVGPPSPRPPQRAPVKGSLPENPYRDADPPEPPAVRSKSR